MEHKTDKGKGIAIDLEYADLDKLHPGMNFTIKAMIMHSDGTKALPMLSLMLSNSPACKVAATLGCHSTTVAIVVPDEAAEVLMGISAATLAANGVCEMPLEIHLLVDTRHVFELKSHTYTDHGDYESFVCSAIIKPQAHIQYPLCYDNFWNAQFTIQSEKKIRTDDESAASTSLVTPAKQPPPKIELVFLSSDEEQPSQPNLLR